MFVTSDDFPIATKAALQYYDEKNLAFDEMYLIGDSLAPKVGKFSPGSISQKNRAHYIELVTALAGFDFFRQPPPPDDAARRIFAAGRESDRVDWAALPVSRTPINISALQSELRLRLTTFTAFAYAMYGYAQDDVLKKPNTDEVFKLVRWYRTNFPFDARKPEAQTHDPRVGAQGDILNAVAGYSRRFLEWISEMDEDNVHLIDHRKIWAGEDMTALASHQESPKAIGTFVKGHVGPLEWATFVTMLGELDLSARNMKPAERFVNVFYDAAFRFCSSNYGLTGATV